MERGRPKTIDEQTRVRICLIARTSPSDWKITAFSTWNLAKLTEHLIAQKVVPAISRETLRRILRDGKVTWQSTTTWRDEAAPFEWTPRTMVLGEPGGMSRWEPVSVHGGIPERRGRVVSRGRRQTHVRGGGRGCGRQWRNATDVGPQGHRP